VVEASKGLPHELELREEALGTWSSSIRISLIDEAQQYFVSIGEPDYGFQVLYKLAKSTSSRPATTKGHRNDPAVACRRAVRRRPPSPLQADRVLREEPEAGACHAGDGAVHLGHDKDRSGTAEYRPDAREYAYERSEVYARFLPKKHHELAQKIARTDPAEAQKETHWRWRITRSTWTASGPRRNAYGMRFLYAELLFKNKNYAEAALRVRTVPRRRNGKYRQAAIVARSTP